jgi:hypothetical protein
MTLSEWLSQESGRMTAMAERFGVNKTAVWGWKVHGVPTARMKAVRDFTGGAVTLEDMVPDPQESQHPAGRPVIDVARPVAAQEAA